MTSWPALATSVGNGGSEDCDEGGEGVGEYDLFFAEDQAACLTSLQKKTMRMSGLLIVHEYVRMGWIVEKMEGKWRIVNAQWSIAARP